jgi:hypothetical protein
MPLHALRSLRLILFASVTAALSVSPSAQQEGKPIPKDSARVLVRGCTKGYIFTAGPRTVEESTTSEIREGMHLRMNGPKKVMGEIKAHEGSMIELVGLMKRGQFIEGANIGHGVRISPGSGGLGNPTAGQPQIDVESWKPIPGACRTK